MHTRIRRCGIRNGKPNKKTTTSRLSSQRTNDNETRKCKTTAQTQNDRESKKSLQKCCLFLVGFVFFFFFVFLIFASASEIFKIVCHRMNTKNVQRKSISFNGFSIFFAWSIYIYLHIPYIVHGETGDGRSWVIFGLWH